MTPNVECEEAQRLNADPMPATHQNRRVLPEKLSPARAWLENEVYRHDGNTSPGEEKRLLSPSDLSPPPASSKSRLQAGLTLGVRSTLKRNAKYLDDTVARSKTKSKFEKTKDKLFAVLKPPYFIISIIAVLVCVHLLVPPEVRSRMEWSPHAWWREPWRLLTYGCVHASIPHLALNSVVALAVGWRLEHEQRCWRVVCVWLGGVAAGALGAGVLQPHVRVVGASAAVYALLTAHLPNVCLKFGHIPLWWFRPLSVLVLGASEGCWALVRTPSAAAQQHDHVAWSAHVLGAAVGIPLAFVFFEAHSDNENKMYIRVSRIISMVLLAMGVTFAIVYYVRCFLIELN